MDDKAKQQLTTFVTSTISTDTTTANQVIKQYFEDKGAQIVKQILNADKK